MADASQDAFRGEDKFKGHKVPLRTLVVLYPNRMHVVTVEGRGIAQDGRPEGQARLDRLARQRDRGDGVPRHRGRQGSTRTSDMKRERLGVAESVNAIKDGKIDAFFWVGGLPTAAVTDLANTPNTKIKMIDHADAVAAMNKKYGNLYVQDTIPKDTYKGMDADNQQATVMNILVAHESMDDKTAYNIVKTIFEQRDDIVAVHKEAHEHQAREPEGRRRRRSRSTRAP